jgi:hypothetical protein
MRAPLNRSIAQLTLPVARRGRHRVKKAALGLGPAPTWSAQRPRRRAAFSVLYVGQGVAQRLALCRRRLGVRPWGCSSAFAPPKGGISLFMRNAKISLRGPQAPYPLLTSAAGLSPGCFPAGSTHRSPVSTWAKRTREASASLSASTVLRQRPRGSGRYQPQKEQRWSESFDPISATNGLTFMAGSVFASCWSFFSTPSPEGRGAQSGLGKSRTASPDTVGGRGLSSAYFGLWGASALP